ncbi:MAG: hypothetical protein GX620_01710 [Chloroflexi bacterium]|nr:hypothetical protein [Chloroflexota bacterium]
MRQLRGLSDGLRRSSAHGVLDHVHAVGQETEQSATLVTEEIISSIGSFIGVGYAITIRGV